MISAVRRALVIAFAAAVVRDARRLGSGADGARSRGKSVNRGREGPEVTAALANGSRGQGEGVRGLGCCWQDGAGGRVPGVRWR